MRSRTKWEEIGSFWGCRVKQQGLELVAAWSTEEDRMEGWVVRCISLPSNFMALLCK